MKASKKNKIRYWIGKLHLWLGLSSGLVVFIISITGCLYAFQAEIQELAQPYRFVTPREKQVLPPSVLSAVAKDLLPGKNLHAVLYASPGKAVQAIFYNFDPYYYNIVYLDPYTAEVLKVKDMETDFFQIVLNGHFYLWLPPAIGQPITAWATLIFVVMLISGIVMWWPKKKKNAKQRFTIRWNARWKRKNYDLHNVLGFYVSCLALVLAFTGLIWGFQWFAKAVYKSAGGEKSLVYTDPASDSALYKSEKPAIDSVFYFMKAQYPQAQIIEVHIPASPSTAIAANANPDEETYWKIDYRYFDQSSLKEVPVDHLYGRFPEAKAADKLLRMNYDIHTGAILGLPGKILAFFISLICASLPVTGFYIWWGRRNKKENAKSKKMPGHTFHRKARSTRAKQTIVKITNDHSLKV